MKKGIIISIGFILFSLGILSLVLQMVGIQFAFLAWIEALQQPFGLLIRILMIMAGLIIMYMFLGNWKEGLDEEN